MLPKLITIGSFYIPTYGVLIAISFLVGLYVTQKCAKKIGLDAEKVSNLAVYCALFGLLGAKITMILFDWNEFAANPKEIFSMATLQAAGVFQGGLILALVFAVFYMRRNGLPFLRTADAFTPGLSIGHAIGRIGCFAAGCCWGNRCDLPWAVTFRNPDVKNFSEVPIGIPLHPAQLYEMGLLALIFVYLYRRFNKPHAAGRILSEYLILSSIARFVVEFYRFHAQAVPFNGPFSITQWISIGLFVLGVVLWFRSKESVAVVPVTA